jgi:hypothetical protein
MPYQNNVFGSAGPTQDTVGNLLNIKQMLPFRNAVVPTGTSSVIGLHDSNHTFYISTVRRTAIWSIGPSVPLPTATYDKAGVE